MFHGEKSGEVLDKLNEVTKDIFSCSKCKTGFKSERKLIQHQMRKIPCDQMPVSVENPGTESLCLVEKHYF